MLHSLGPRRGHRKPGFEGPSLQKILKAGTCKPLCVPVSVYGCVSMCLGVCPCICVRLSWVYLRAPVCMCACLSVCVYLSLCVGGACVHL